MQNRAASIQLGRACAEFPALASSMSETRGRLARGAATHLKGAFHILFVADAVMQNFVMQNCIG